ncbi:M24 family metallopeptidase [Lujinxingia vulgaris]|uniref:Xaa-Pro aminopeptidase n=1 Tax=Lujinxingia vulgaris TaxID=2600176 RepID=A0A5C6X018_9DELT|nr:aminopeptidase P N-terminal domain-containing protein [Lujinxingia vulgaris]TXD32037.1 M24 family metallopeptidase [Lujinxingia vulgaris]
MVMIEQEVFEARRARLMETIGPEGVLIVVGPSMRQRSNDTEYTYRPSSDLLYLSGFREPESVLVLAPGREEGAYGLFVPDRDPSKEQWEGRRAGPEGAVARFGADVAFGLSELDEELPKFLKGRQTLYYTLGVEPAFDQRVIGWVQSLRHRRNQHLAMPAAIADARDLLFEARLIKEEAELNVLRRACEISAEAHILAMKHCRPGMMEYELQALIEYHFRRSGGTGPAYASIVGGGDNATILHYTENEDRIGEDDVVLIDAGCEYGYYAGDITRSFPASGRFSEPQRRLYQAVLDVLEATTAMIKPGLPYESLQEEASKMLAQAMIDLGILNETLEETLESKSYRKYYPHGIGHWLGMDVHDVGLYKLDEDTSRPLKPGMVLTIEPGIYVPADDENAPEELRGIGVRIEDDILVTAEGYENLTAMCPKAIDEVEALVGSADSEALKL